MGTAVFVDTESLVGSLSPSKFTPVNVDAVIFAACKSWGLDRTSIAHYAAYGPWWIKHDGLAAVGKAIKEPPAKLVATRYVKGKSVLDTHLVVDAAYYDVQDGATTYVIVSSDADMVPLVDHLRSRGRRIYGIGRTSETKEQTADAYDRFIWFSRQELQELSAEASGLPPEVADLRRWVLEIMGNHSELPASRVATTLHTKVQAATGASPGEHFEATLGVRQFKKVIGKLFPGQEIGFTNRGHTIARGPATSSSVELPSFRGEMSPPEDPEADLLDDEDLPEWDAHRWSVLPLPTIQAT